MLERNFYWLYYIAHNCDTQHIYARIPVLVRLLLIACVINSDDGSRIVERGERIDVSGAKLLEWFRNRIGSRPNDHYFRSVCWFVCLTVCVFVCAEFFSAVFDPISIKLGDMLHVRV